MGLDFGEEAQVSAELLIVIAAVVAVALMFVTGLIDTGQRGKEKLGAGANKTLDKIEETLNQSG